MIAVRLSRYGMSGKETDAYEDKEKYRFCTIDIKSPEEYDLKVECAGKLMEVMEGLGEAI